MLDKYQRYVPKPTNISELKTILKAIWSDLPQGPIDEAVLSFRKRLQACIKASGGHFEHALKTDVRNINISFFALQLRHLLFRLITG